MEGLNIDVKKEQNVLLLMKDVHEKYGYDFSQYALASLIRRVERIIQLEKVPTFAELRCKVLNDPLFFEYFLEEVTVNVTEMFRDPEFFRVLREKVIPLISTYPVIRIWHAGCSSGEEAFSVAIILKEEGLLERSLIYATDLNQKVIEQAQEGILPLDQMKAYTRNYIESGGINDFSDYYTANYGRAIVKDYLKSRMVFSMHNLVSDQSFNEFNLIVCRNVLIYFKQDLQNHILKLFSQSLPHFGYLALGTKETIEYSDVHKDFEITDKPYRIYRKTSQNDRL